MVRAVRNALALSFVAEVVALLTGRIPYLSGLFVLASVSYLVEAVDKWRDERRPAPVQLDGATSITLSAAGTRRLAALQQPRSAGNAAEQGTDIGDGAVEVVDLGAELADDRDELLQRA
jgi:hypothetical protein